MSALDRLLFLQGGKCYYCGQILSRQDATVDHVLPQSMGGKADPDNLVARCRTIIDILPGLKDGEDVKRQAHQEQKMPSNKWAALLLLFVVYGISAANNVDGRVVAIHDGDTITLIDRWNRQHRIRLSQIDAPEIGHGKNDPGQPFGKVSKQSLSDLVHGKEVRADCDTSDKYGRIVCTIWDGRTNVNLEQVRRGMAWVFRKYASESAYYLAEDTARRSRIGIWSQPDPIPPWEWRHRQTKTAE